MFDFTPCQIQETIFPILDKDHFQDLFPDLDLEVLINQLNVIIVIAWGTQQIIVSDIRTKMFHIDNLIKVGKTIIEILKDIQTTDQILDIEQLALLSIELIFQSHQCIWIYRQGINNKH